MDKNELELLKNRTYELMHNLWKSKSLGVFQLSANADKYGIALKNLTPSDALEISDKRVQSMFFLAMFLWIFEGIYTNFLDTYCLLLIENEHDLFNPRTQKYVSSLKELDAVDIEYKFKFLKFHNFDMLVKRDYQEFRNKIAHHDFLVDNESRIIIKGKPIDISARLVDLFDFILTVYSVFVETTGKIASLSY